MSARDDANGGPAFPCDVFDPDVRGPEQWEGMSMRDYFAAQVIGHLVGDKDSMTTIQQDVASAYKVAAAMLAERAK